MGNIYYLSVFHLNFSALCWVSYPYFPDSWKKESFLIFFTGGEKGWLKISKLLNAVFFFWIFLLGRDKNGPFQNIWSL